MEFFVDLNSVKSVRSKYPLTILDNQVLNSNEKFSFLKSELINFYNNHNPVRSTRLHVCSTSKYKKQLYINLHLILTEVVLTTDKKIRHDLLERAYSWYNDKVGISKTQTPSTSKLVKKKIKIKSLEPSKCSISKRETPYNASLIKIPNKKKEKSQENSVEKYAEKYYKMIENEKISFNVPLNRGFINKTPDRKIIDSSFSDREEVLKTYSKKNHTPELLQYDNYVEQPLIKPIKDFRKVAHKFRMIKKSTLNREVEQLTYLEAREIKRIKDKMSKKNIKVSINTLENALCLHKNIKLNSSSHKRLPNGGEFLLKAKFPILKPKISSIITNTKL